MARRLCGEFFEMPRRCHVSISSAFSVEKLALQKWEKKLNVIKMILNENYVKTAIGTQPLLFCTEGMRTKTKKRGLDEHALQRDLRLVWARKESCPVKTHGENGGWSSATSGKSLIESPVAFELFNVGKNSY